MKALNLRRTVFLVIGILVAAMILVTTSLFGMNP